MFLAALRHGVGVIKGVGPKTTSLLARHGIHSVGELLRHFPRRWEDRQTPAPLSKWRENDGTVNTTIQVVAHDYFGWGGKLTLKVVVEGLGDGEGVASLICYNRNFLANKLTPGSIHLVYGIFSEKYGELQSATFETAVLGSSDERDFRRILPIYPLWEGISQGSLRKNMLAALNGFGAYIEEELPVYLCRKRGLLSLVASLRQIHFPDSMEQADTALLSLKYHELFMLQLTVARHSFERRAQVRTPKKVEGNLVKRLVQSLPFELTTAQNRVIQEIQHDLASDRAMARLLQGEVGSGKTLVAFIASLLVVERGDQVAFMAPTSLLAQQHYSNAQKLLQSTGISIGLITGGQDNTVRQATLDAMNRGDLDLLIGTHSLLSDALFPPNLGLAIVDEQHRFGVVQRNTLYNKGEATDLLLMTATPIPRTLTMTAFGDLEHSILDHLPKGRHPIKTHLSKKENATKVYDRVRHEIEAGRQAYFVYPLIEESTELKLDSAEEMYELLSSEIFPDFKIALLHSRLPEEEKRARMAEFTRGRVDILVGTSVVEVGVDVPNATCMVVGSAEHFGLSSLHQLRGRVGRGPYPSTCFLIYGRTLTEEGKARLRVMLETANGFDIAEEDLKIRGPGDLTGSLQSGFLRFKIADITQDFELLKLAREDAFELVSKDPGLLSEENTQLRKLFAESPPYPDGLIAAG